MDAHHPAVEEAARAAMERLEAAAPLPAIVAIKAIPRHLVTPSVIEDLAAALATLAGGLSAAPREVAHGYLDDLYDDMRGVRMSDRLTRDQPIALERSTVQQAAIKAANAAAGSDDTALLDWLDRQRVDAIYIAAGCIDVRNGGGSARACIAEARRADSRNHFPREAAAFGAGLDSASLEQGDPT